MVRQLAILFCCFLAGCHLATRPDPEPATLATSRQMLLVTAPTWDSTRGVLRRYQRSDAGSPWTQVGGPIPVLLGRNGLAWGAQALSTALAGPWKREGDGKAPAGVFALPSAFGYGPAEALASLTMPYVQSTPDYKCVDDGNSRHYNRMVLESQVAKDWTSHEDMRRPDPLYGLGLVVAHNWAPRTEPGRGSCIFLHIQESPDTPTSGCTAMDGDAMAEVMKWLDPGLQPRLVQLPEEAYAALREAWKLPWHRPGH